MNNKLRMYEFDSVTEFLDYIKETPKNKMFKGDNISSERTDKDYVEFSGTSEMEEANNLLICGWEYKAEELENKIKAMSKELGIGTNMTNKRIYDVAGYISDVPRYLNGIPNCMIRDTSVRKVDKIIRIVKNITVCNTWTSEEITEESAKTLMIVKRLETLGYNVELYVGMVIRESKNVLSDCISCKIKIKKSTERINTLKLSYPLCHPSMLRRHMSQFIETLDAHKSIVKSYGYMADSEVIKEAFKGCKILDAKISADITKIKSIEEIC